MIQGSDKPFPYDVKNVMVFEVNKTSDQELLHNVIQMAKTFFKFISVNSKVDIINPVMIGCGNDINEYTTMLYIKPDNVEACTEYERNGKLIRFAVGIGFEMEAVFR